MFLACIGTEQQLHKSEIKSEMILNRIHTLWTLTVLIVSCYATSEAPSAHIRETSRSTLSSSLSSLSSSYCKTTPSDTCMPSFNASQPTIHSNSSQLASAVYECIENLDTSHAVDPNSVDVNASIPNFQSFEEWKKNKLSNNNYSAANTDGKKKYMNNTNIEIQNRSNNSTHINSNSTNQISKDLKQIHQQRNRKREDGDNNQDENQLGDDMVIEISMFSGAEEDQGKLYKDRFNYASFDCAATIVKTNKEAKGANSVLLDNKDTYLLNECSAQNNFIIIELCEDILVDEVLIGNYEFYSSMFKELKISVSDRFPTTQWYMLGEFQAANIRKLQTFNIENSLIWAKFIKIEFLSHYGNEFYCPISSVQVHGTTMIEQFKDENPDIEENNEVFVISNNSIMEMKPEFDVTFDQFSDIHFEDLEGEQNGTSSTYLKLDQFLNEYKKQNDEFDQCLVEDNHKTVETSSQIPKLQPQESIYKNLAKRLSLLESNATLSLLYIEEQSKLLSEAFSNLEKEQSIKFQNILIQLNTTIQSQMTIFQKLNMDVYTSFSRLFEYQQQNFDERTIQISDQIGSISNMISFYKTLTYLCLVIIVSLFIYILMTKNVYIDESFPRLVGMVPTSPSISPSGSMFNVHDGSVISSRHASYGSDDGSGKIFKSDVVVDPFTPEPSVPPSPRRSIDSESDYIYEE